MPFKPPDSLSNALPNALHDLLRSALLCVLLAVLTSPAHARALDFRGHRAAFRAQGDARPRSMERVPRQSPARLPQQRDAPAVDRPQQGQLAAPGQPEGQARPPAPQPAEPPPTEATRPGRLTPDERRALRQQINEAGRDIYRPGRP